MDPALSPNEPRDSADIAEYFRAILESAGEDTTRPGIIDTPQRFAKFFQAACAKPPPINFKVFPEEYSITGMQIQDGISVASLCEHHTLPFFGTVSIGYLPRDNRICGLSKLRRVVEHFSAGLQVQERIAERVAEFLMSHQELLPYGVGVSMRCYHTCMTIRGVRQPNAVTTTHVLKGLFRDDVTVKEEFLRTLRHPTII